MCSILPVAESGFEVFGCSAFTLVNYKAYLILLTLTEVHLQYTLDLFSTLLMSARMISDRNCLHLVCVLSALSLLKSKHFLLEQFYNFGAHILADGTSISGNTMTKTL